MQRREFLTAVGLGLADVTIVKKLWAFQLPTAATQAAQKVNNALPFKRYKGRLTAQLLTHRKFRYFVQTQFPNVRTPFHWNLPVWGALWGWLQLGKVSVLHKRFIVATGFMKGVAQRRGMIWIDATKQNEGQSPLTVLTFLTTELGERFNTLWIIPNRPISDLPRTLSHQYPVTLGRWLRTRTVGQDSGKIGKVVFYEPTEGASEPLLSAFGIQPKRLMPSFASQSKPWSELSL